MTFTNHYIATLECWCSQMCVAAGKLLYREEGSTFHRLCRGRT